MSADRRVAMTAPKRIQRKRTKGWRTPEGAVYVGRPTKWGNPFTVMNGHRQGWLIWDDRSHQSGQEGYVAAYSSKASAVDDAAKRFAAALRKRDLPLITAADVVRELEGRDLACWCPLDQPCHADALLEIANSEVKP